MSGRTAGVYSHGCAYWSWHTRDHGRARLHLGVGLEYPVMNLTSFSLNVSPARDLRITSCVVLQWFWALIWFHKNRQSVQSADNHRCACQRVACSSICTVTYTACTVTYTAMLTGQTDYVRMESARVFAFCVPLTWLRSGESPGWPLFAITVWYKLCRYDHSVLELKSFSPPMNW